MSQPISNFSPVNKRKDGTTIPSVWCRPCAAAHRRAKYAENPDRYRTERKAYYQANQETERNRSKKRMAQRRTTDPDYAAYMATYGHNRYLANREALLQQSKQWARANQSKMRLIKANWSRRNTAYVNEATQIRRARRRANGGSFTRTEWRELCAKYDHRCLACHARGPLTPDHIIPVSRGGTSNIDNIQPLCMSCNSRKGVREIDYRTRKHTYQPES